jgi:WD40 repeat protein
MRRELEGAGEYTSVAVEALCEALTKPACMLKDLRIFGNCWGNKDAHKLATSWRLRAVIVGHQRRRLRRLTCAEMKWGVTQSRRCLRRPPMHARWSTCRNGCGCGATLNAHTNWGETLQHDEKYMYSGSQDQTIRKWRRSDLRCEAVLKGHEKGVLSLKLLGDILYAGDRKGEIKLWKVPLIAIDGR